MIALAFPGARDLPVDPSPSLAVLGFATAVSLATAFAVGLVPALIGSRADPIDAMRGAGRVAGDRGSRLRQTLVSLQVAHVARAGRLRRPPRHQPLQPAAAGLRVPHRGTLQPPP